MNNEQSEIADNQEIESSSSPTEQPQVRDPERFTGHRVRLQVFEGPLDLLLYLVRAHRYDIFDIPIQEVTNEFVAYLKLMDEVDLEYAGDFLVTAASLMQIKARMLLPKQQSANEDALEDEGRDPRKELVDRLLEYQKFQEAADTLKDLRDVRLDTFARPPQAQSEVISGDEEDPEKAAALLLEDVSTFDLLRALQKVLDRLAERPTALIRREPFTIQERIRDLHRRIALAPEGITFRAACDDCETRLEVVITFLAVLELIRRGRARVEQKELFDEIFIKMPDA
ncbi:MAG TPA: segregation/condensation protein A [Abditibacteriaceae bacterium]